MYLLYVDESGDPTNATEENFVLGGIAAFERVPYHLSQQLDALEIELFGGLALDSEAPSPTRPVEFHAAQIYRRSSSPWDTLNRKEATRVLERIAAIVADSHHTCALFTVVVHRPSYPDQDPVVLAFEELTSRFDLFLNRLEGAGDKQRGLMVFDESRHERRLQTLLKTYQTEGGPFGRLRNMADVPFFADSRSSRMLQIADFIAWATFRRYERGVTNHFDLIVSRFDAVEYRLHGLIHRTGNFRKCYCPGCLSRHASAS